MALKFEKRSYKLTGLTPLLGTQPTTEELLTTFLMSKCEGGIPDITGEGTRDPQTPQIRDYADEEAKRLTVFAVDDAEVPVLLDYQIKGFFKESFTILKSQFGVAQPRSKLDGLLFIEPTQIYIYRDDKMLEEVDGRKDRPARIKLPMGAEMTTILSSEIIRDPWEIEFDVILFDNAGTKVSKSVVWDLVESALDYGSYHGFLQWRNGGFGRFNWVRTDKPKGKKK